MKNILITGSEGYIGSVLVPLLLQEPSHYKLTLFDTCFFGNSNYDNENTKRILKDIRLVSLEDLKDIDVVIHLAALSNDPIGELDQSLTEEINHSASINFASLAKEAGVKKFIFSSSCSVYGSNERTVSEVFDTNPLTTYAKSKLLTENSLKLLADKEFCPIFLRNATVYGLAPQFRVDLAINNLTFSAYTQNKIILKSQGNAFRPFIHVRDLSRIFKLMIDTDSELIYNEIFNIGDNNSNFRIKYIADVISMETNKPVIISDGAALDNRNYKVNFTKFKKYFPDFKFYESINTSIKEMFNYFDYKKFTSQDEQSLTRLNVLQNLMKTQQLNNKLYWNTTGENN